ncbi:putative LTR retrotransposon, partial [Pseudoloma neurophilia]
KPASKNNENSIAFIRETPSKVQKIELDGKIGNESIKLIIDTGATSNFFSERMRKLGTPVPLDQPITIKLANGSQIKAKEKFQAKINLPIDLTTEYKIEGYVIDGMGDDVILGMTFMMSNEVEINCKTNTIRIDGIYHQMSNTRSEEFDPDQKLCEKACLIEKTPHSDIEKLLINYKLSNPEFGLLKGYQHEINLTSDKPIQKSAYKIPDGVRNEFKSQITDLEKKGIIRKSRSQYASPCFGILKKNGKMRIVTNYIALNNITENEVYHFPDVHKSMNRLKDCTIFSQIDLESGFNQIEVAERDIHKTAFICEMGHYEYLRMPFGLKNAPKSFQRIMEEVLEGIDCVTIFVDDILIASKNPEQHYEDLKIVLERLKEKGAKINFEKSSFAKEEIKFLGCIINKNGIKADLSGVKTVRNRPAPKTRKEVQKLIGIFNWFRKFVPKMAELTEKITDKLKGQLPRKINWTEEDEKCRQEIFDRIEENLILSHSDYTRPFTLHTDASNIGIGGILTQDDKIIGIYSKKLNKSETNYTTVE